MAETEFKGQDFEKSLAAAAASVAEFDNSKTGPLRRLQHILHGTPSLVPMIVLGPRPVDQPALHIERVEQVGSVSEGEELELKITVVPMQIALPEMSITLTFSREEIPTRREVFRGAKTTYTVRWQPKLGEVTDEDRRQGAVVQPVTVILSYREGRETVRLSRTIDVRIKLDPTRLRRRVDSKLDLLMGKVPKGLKS